MPTTETQAASPTPPPPPPVLTGVGTLLPLIASPSPVASVAPSASPSPSPTPVPSPFAQTNTFTFGSPPTNNYAAAGDAVQIYYATFTPTIVSYGTPVKLLAVTTTNVARLSLSYNGVSTSINQTGPGQWASAFPFTLIGTPAPSGSISLTLSAAKSDGTQASIAIPVTVASP